MKSSALHVTSNQAMAAPNGSALAVRPDRVVQLGKPSSGRPLAEGAMWSTPLIELEPAAERRGALARVVSASMRVDCSSRPHLGPSRPRSDLAVRAGCHVPLEVVG
jgi:hypothetical protein